VQLPLALMPAHETSPDGVPNSADASPGVAGMRRRRVLIVDDNLDAAEMLGLLAEELGSEVCTAADGAQAIEIAADFRPEIVLMDLGMPRMNGYDAAAHIRNQSWGKEMMLVALTGWGQEK